MGLRSEQHLKHYVVKELIACGGMGEVWRAWDESHNCFVAIKAITSDLVSDPKFTNRFLDETRRHSRLQHPNIIPVLDVFQVDNQNCLVMELIDGSSLDSLLESQPQHLMEASKAVPILQDLLNALNYAHQQGVIHRDVKPSNVLLDKAGRAHLIDFGIALAIGEARRTRTGQAIGTPHYMSPEQIIRPREVDHRSDVYSVGCVFYEMLTGRPPFVADSHSIGDTDFAIKQAHINQQPIPPKERIGSIPQNINDVIMVALEKSPQDRIPGCGEFVRLLSTPEQHRYSSTSRWIYACAVVLIILWLYVVSLLLMD